MNAIASGPAAASSEGLTEHWLEFLWLEKGLAQETLCAYRGDLHKFATWLAGRKQAEEGADHTDRDDLLTAADSGDLSDYIAWQLQADIAVSSVARCVSSLRGFYGWYGRRQGQNSIAAFLEAIKNPRRLPQLLSEADVRALLAAVPQNSPRAVRDRAMLELMYAAGLRVSELVSLQRQQLDLDRGVVRLFGKGARERLTLMGDEAISWHRRYLSNAWPELAPAGTSWLYPGGKGGHITRQAFWYRVRHYAGLAGLAGSVSPHSLRHAFATHMLDNGSDLRVIQMLLGHADLSTTQLYTQVGKKQLFDLHRQHHPRG